MLSDAEQIIASRWIWKWLESSRSYDLSDQNLRKIALEAELLDGKTEFSVKKITKYLNNILDEDYIKWVALPRKGGRLELLLKKKSQTS